MAKSAQFLTPSEAKVYLIERIAEQADEDGTPLTEKQRRVLSFTELESIDAEFDSESAEVDETFEHTITELLRRRYRKARKDEIGEASNIRQAVKIMAKEDHYLNVMAEPALNPMKDLSIGAVVLVLLALFSLIYVAVLIIDWILK